MDEELDKENFTSNGKNVESGDEVKKDFQGLLTSTKRFLNELLDIRPNTDQEATKDAIIADIPFKGHTSWILICSIFIASVGLNANSTAVVIGAMLISPLMGPILGVGMSIAINDIDTLRRSLKNFAVMVILSVLTAYLFFLSFPLRDESSELLARTAPDIRDVLIAFFGGLALVIARAKKGTIASVIFGVAIATALMPPLCTVGFGLAIGNFDYAGGAMYLFAINSIFIALATFLVIKILRFPMVKYVNSKRRSFISRMASVVAILVMVPAGFTFFDVWQESSFKNQANQFINEKIVPYQFSDGGRFLKEFSNIQYNHGEESRIDLVFMGNVTVPDNIIATWNSQMSEYSALKGTDLQIIQGSSNAQVDQLKYVNELYESQKSALIGKDGKINLLENELIRLKRSLGKQIPFKEISAEARANYENLNSLSFSYTIKTDFSKLDTVPIFEVEWKKEVPEKNRITDSKKLEDWLRLRLQDNGIQLKQAAN